MEKRWRRYLYQPVLPLGKDGKLATGSAEHTGLSRAAASESMVLLKNERKILPLQKGTKVALFGKGTADYVKGGGGSGDVICAYTRSLCDGLRIKQKEGKAELFEELAQFYEENIRAQYADGASPGMTAEPEVPSELFEKARAYTDTAIITISRFSGEGWDRKTVVNGSYRLDRNEQKMFDLSSKLFEDGDFSLTKAERNMVQAVTDAFAKVIVVLNIGGMCETAWIRDNDRIQAALFAGQGGMEGGLAAADILTGDVNPSGHLTDTYAEALEDYPSTAGFHESTDYVDYTEDIYVGYRYFETIPGARQKVVYPFGYGLSYSDFLIRPTFAQKAGGQIVLNAQVTNLSEMPGKQVVQVYAKLPQAKLGKPRLTLVSFAKTGLLGMGCAQTLDLSFPLSRLASYDDTGRVKKSAWILEEGSYELYIGDSAENLDRVPFDWHVSETIVIEQLSEKAAPRKLRKRMLSDGSFEDLPTGEYPVRKLGLEPQKDVLNDFSTPYVPARGGHPFESLSESDGRIRLEDVADGAYTLDQFTDQLTDDELIALLGGQPNTGVANTFGFGNNEAYGIPDVMTADGPAGLRVWEQTGVTTTAWPVASLLACSWDCDLLFRVGQAGGREVRENNIGIWLTPAVNIHRSPLCGRNFEYYSEDPLVAGLLAGAMVRGIQSEGVGASVKHFCANNKETNRRESDSRVSERALREIYLKAFELIVKREKPLTIMSSYNLLNGTHTSENKDLLTGILRDEWGFDGAVTTDWWTTGEHYLEAKAGNDIKMASGHPERVKEAYEKGLISREEILTCAGRVLKMILKLD